MAKSGMLAQVKIAGAAVAFAGEATTGAGDLVYQITDLTKRILDRTIDILVHVFTANNAAEAGTTTTNIKVTAHGLAVNDLIVNTSRADAARLVTVVVDVDNVTVAAVTSQTDTDTIAFYPTAADSATTKNRLTGSVTFTPVLARVVKISSSYIPLTAAAEAHAYAYVLKSENIDITKFSLTHTYRTRQRTIKDISGSISEWATTDTTFHDALIAGLPVMIEFWSDTGGTLDVKAWVLLNRKAIAAVADGEIDETVDFEGTMDADNNSVSFS